MRFFAALYVIFYHYRWGIPSTGVVDRFLSVGYASVCFFFLLSGYILATVYLRTSKEIAPRKFYVARFARIYPLYIVSVVVDAPFSVLSRIAKYGLGLAMARVGVQFLSSAVMLQMLFPIVTTINAPSWSLAIETVFYLSFPVLGKWLWAVQKRGVWIAGTLLYVLGMGIHWVVAQRWSEPIPVLDLVPYVTTFALGILVARWQILSAAVVRGAGRSNGKAWLIFLSSCTGFAWVVYESPWLTQLRFHFGLLLAPVFMGLIWTLSTSQILPVRLLSAKWLVLLGEASYGLYLLQTPVQHVLRALKLTGSPWDYPVYLGSCIGLSILSFYFLEKPARQWILKVFHSRTKETMEAASAAQ